MIFFDLFLNFLDFNSNERVRSPKRWIKNNLFSESASNSDWECIFLIDYSANYFFCNFRL